MVNTRRKHWRKRLDQAVRVLLAAAMVLQLSAGGLRVAFASDSEWADGREITGGLEDGAALDEGSEDEEVPEDEEIPADEEIPDGDEDLDSIDVQDDGGNLLYNENRTALGVWTFDENGASSTITIGGADWSTMLKYPVQLDAGFEYEVSVTLTSTVERTITLDIGDLSPREYTSDIIPANEPTTVTYTSVRGIGGERILGIYMGLEGEAFPGEHTVTITDVRVTEGDKLKMPGEDTEDGAPVEEVAGNLLVNGNFANKSEGWEAQTLNADVYFNAYRTVFYLKNTAADWQQGLKRPLNLASGKYIVTFTVETDVERTVSVNLRDVETGAAFVSETIPAGVPTEVTFVTDGAARDVGTFYLYLGDAAGVTYPNSVVISNVSVVEKPVELANDENDEAPAPIDSIAGTNAAEMTVLKDGTFTQGMANWDHWAQDWMVQWDVVKYTPVEDGVAVYITNVGDGEGNVAWDVQLNQKINLKAGLTYTLSFDVTTEKARAFNAVINAPWGDGILNKTVGLQAGETRHVVFNVPVQEADLTDCLFSFQLGSNNHTEIRENTLTFKNVKIEVNGYSEKAVLIDDGEFTDGLGAFTTANAASVTAQNGSVIATGSTLSREVSGMEAGAVYTLSFMAGAVDAGSITVTLPDGGTKTFDLTDTAKLCTADFTANNASGSLTFDFGTGNTVCLDTVRLDAKGYAEAAGLDVTRHDIQRLTKNQAPLISEMALAEFGEDVVLTYAADEAYKEAITSVKVDGAEVEYTLGEGVITLDSGLFNKTSGGDRQAYDITVSAYWYEENNAIQIVYEPGVFTEIWADEFNGNALDTTKWGYQDGTGAEYGLDGWGNNEQQYYTRENLTVGDGAMTITATKGTHGKPYNSTRIWTQNQAGTETYFAQTYGHFEAKMKLPAGDGCQGLWPAFWLLPVDTSIYGGWPLSGEIDIMEARGREGNKADGTIHFGRPWPNDGASGSSMEWTDDPLAITNYHIYSVDWTPTYMSFQVDGEEYYRAENWYSQSDDQPTKYAFPAPFDQDFYIIFNMAVGGTYDGNLNPDDSVLPAEMKVDYVRVYQFTDLPDGIVDDPDTTPDPIPAGTKDYIIDPDFTDVKKVVNDDDPKNVDGWNLLTLSQFGGAADFSTVDVDGTTFAKVNITNGGSQNYSIQLTQRLSLYYGNWYTLSFDAYADSPREIIAKIGGDGTNSWAAYNSVTTALGREVKHYEYTFQMLNTSDPSSRLEMNMGYGTGPVYIANVEFKSADGLTIDPDVVKTPLENGNGIYNGSFGLGTNDRLAYWHADGGETVKDGSSYYFQAGANGATLYQTGIELLQSDTYELDAKVTGAVSYTITSADGSTTYASGDLNGKQTFTMPAGVTDKNATITFTLASGAALDDISLIRTTYNNVDYSGLDCYPMVNGDFENGNVGWGTYNTNLNVVDDGTGNHIGQVASGGSNRWDALLSQDLHLLGGYAYELSFRAKASTNAVIDISMEDANYSRSFEQLNINVGTEWATYTYGFKFTADKDLALKFLVGGGNFTFSLDDVVIKMVGAPAQPGAFAVNSHNTVGTDIIVAYTGSADWTEKAVLTLNGEVIPGDKYSFNNGELTLDASLFPASGEYILAASAEGYANSKDVTIRVYSADGDLIFNGGFDLGQEGWETYIHGGSSAALNFAPGYLDARYIHAEGDEWGNPSVPWSIQLNQHITVANGGKYVLHFMASSELARNIRVGIDGGKFEQFTLTDEWTEYTMELNFANAGDYQVMFQLGTVNPDNTENGYFPKDGFVDFPAHNFYLDHISLIPENSEYAKEAIPTSLKVADTSVTAGSPVEVTVEIAHPVDGGNQPTGSVTFTVNGEPVPATDGVLNLDTSKEGEYTVKAVYEGDEHFDASEAEIVVTVKAADIPDKPDPDPDKPDPNPDKPTVPSTPNTPIPPSVPSGSSSRPGNSGSSANVPATPSNPGENIGEDDVPLVRALPFTDVASNNWYFDAVKYMFNKGIMNGITGTSFAPDGTITRGMIVTMLYRLESEPDAGLSAFSDVADSAYYAKAVAWAVKTGIVTGYDSSRFGPDDLATREQTAVILYRYAAYKNYSVNERADLSAFADAEQISGYALEGMSWANAMGLVNGRSASEMVPAGQTTRAEMAALLMRFCMNIAGMK